MSQECDLRIHQVGDVTFWKEKNKRPSTSCRFMSEKGSVKHNLTIGITCALSAQRAAILYLHLCACVCPVYVCSLLLLVYAPEPSLFSLRIKIIQRDPPALTSRYDLIWFAPTHTDTALVVAVVVMSSSARWFSRRTQLSVNVFSPSLPDTPLTIAEVVSVA